MENEIEQVADLAKLGVYEAALRFIAPQTEGTRRLVENSDPYFGVSRAKEYREHAEKALSQDISPMMKLFWHLKRAEQALCTFEDLSLEEDQAKRNKRLPFYSEFEQHIRECFKILQETPIFIKGIMLEDDFTNE